MHATQQSLIYPLNISDPGPDPEKRALRARVADLERLVRDHDLAPFPPGHLRLRVGGWEDLDHFLGVGRKVFWDLKRMLHMAGREIDSFRDILDFGCGCGRTLRFFPHGSRRLTGCDIDAESIAWCRSHIGDMATFKRTGEMPPLPFDSARFDFVYAISVFTHLPEDMQLAWLDELARVIAPGGVLLASTHGDTLLAPDTEPALRERLLNQGFLYVKGAGTGGLPTFYQTAFHTEGYVKERWSGKFRWLCSMHRGINNHQDAHVFERVT